MRSGDHGEPDVLVVDVRRRRYARMLWIVEPVTPAAYLPA